MKNTIAAVFMLIGLLAFAQESNLDRTQKRNLKERFNFTAEQRAELKSKKMTLDLNLSEKQILEIRKILLERSKTFDIKRQELKSQQKEGKELSQDEKFNLINQKLDYQIAMKSKMEKILTEDQFKKWEEGSKKRRQQLKKRKAGRI